jgi:hypothetical protein
VRTRANQATPNPQEQKSMIEDGRAFGVNLALKHILALLERKGLVSQSELTDVLDVALEELQTIANRNHQDQSPVMAPEAVAEAGRAIGSLYVRE